MVLIILLLLEIFFLILILPLIFSTLIGAPFYPSHNKAIENLLDLAKPNKSDIILDIGSGDGRVVNYLAGKGFRATGIEINPILVLISKYNIRRAGNNNRAKIVWGNLWNHDFSQYDMIFCYLFPITMDKLKHKLEKELKPGTKFVSNSFKINSLKPIKSKGKIFLYKF